MHTPRTVVARDGIAMTAFLRQRTEMFLASLTTDRPSLIIVREGVKCLRRDGRECVLRPGDGVALAAGQSLDILNTPSPAGWYEASWLVFAPEVVDRFAIDRPGPAPVRDWLRLSPLEPGFAEAYDRAVDAVLHVDRVPDAVAIERMREVLAWLEACGGRLSGARVETVSGRVRALLDADPEKPWTAAQVAKALAMSEATMRRRLAAENQSLTRIQTDLRMSRALFLLQATDRPILQIAFDVGYESASRFAARFRERFGHPPSAVRGEPAVIERFGTGIERSRGADGRRRVAGFAHR